MKHTPVVATALVAFFVVGVPIALIVRLADGLVPTQAYDPLLAVAIVAWLFVSKAILDRDELLPAVAQHRFSPRWQAHHLVEQSLLGVGFEHRAATTGTPSVLPRLTAADLDITSLLPPEQPAPIGDLDLDRDRPPAGPRRPIPTLPTDEPVAPPIVATEEYVVGRGDTFWSIADERLGDGRRWTSLEALNVDRQVAPGVVFRRGDVLRIGWTLLVPATDDEAAR